MALGELGYCAHFARRAGLLGEFDLRRLGALEDGVAQHLDGLLRGGPAAPASPDGNHGNGG